MFGIYFVPIFVVLVMFEYYKILILLKSIMSKDA